MSEIKVSLSASAVRPHLWRELLNSLRGSKYKYEVVFAGFIDKKLVQPFLDEYPELKYIFTEDIKPSQCYEIARRACTGELIGWMADDCVYSEGYIDKVYDYWKFLNRRKVVLSCRTNENNNKETMLNHRFFGRNQNTPLMAPLGIMSREYLQSLGGYDSRYIAGQYENDVCMRILADGGAVMLYAEVCVSIDHQNKHGSLTNFWSGYNQDREQLENSWVIGGYKKQQKPLLVLEKPGMPPHYHYLLDNQEVTLNRNDKFSPFKDQDILTISQEPQGRWV